jgi:para-aminobenzoate synthetase/4-amino-4-deoxychorismate lyase
VTETPFVLLDDSLTPGGRCLLFEKPVEVVRCDEPDQAEAALARVAAAGGRGLYAAGFMSYELGYLMEDKLAGLLPRDRRSALLWFGLFDTPREMDHAAAGKWVRARAKGGYRLDGLSLSVDQAGYLTAARRVKDYIAAGDVYQINLTFKYEFDFSGDPFALYGDLRHRQRVAHGALIAAPGFSVVSLSPELFLRVHDGRAEARPMKGTAPRAADPAADAALAAWLKADEKSRAENLMIVDLLRNDLGRVAEIGSVEVSDLFTVESYPTVHQMTSGITARLRPGVGLPELARGLFPCGSVTGAPKVRAMEIIRELELAPRGVYTGAIGYLAPGGEAAFNVAIRTLVLDAEGRGEMGVGSGIVQDSDPEAEFEECLLKARFLTEDRAEFRLIETLRWRPEEGYYLLDRHLSRLAASAAYFGFPCDRAAVERRLRAEDLEAARPMRVRLLLDAEGEIEIEAVVLQEPEEGRELGFALAERRVDSRDPFFYHKTTRREVYDGELARLRAETGCDEVVFLNERGELTEGSFTNLFVGRDGRLLTPPVSCGLLDGTLRRELIEDPGTRVEERVLGPEDLESADRVFLGNSVRGLLPARRIA